jgi:general secretion pathway protein G
MQTTLSMDSWKRRRQKGTTFLELIVAVTILGIISTAAIGTVRFKIIREREWELRRDLREMRTAIDKFKDLADKNLIRTAVGSEGYPPDLDALVKGVDIGPSGPKVRFLRRVPTDPMTGRTDWVLRSLQEDPDSTEWSGNNVFDVRSSSQANGLDGTPYSKW